MADNNFFDNMDSTLNTDIIGMQIRTEQAKRGFANVMHECLMDEIANFEKSLKDDEEVAAYLSSFGQRILIQIDQINYRNPFLIILSGTNTETGEKLQLAQHCNQLNVLFVAVKVKEKRPARRIGFRTDDEE